MQEEVENRSVTLAISATKLTGRLLKAAISKYMQYKKTKRIEKSNNSPVKPQGKQTVKELVGQNQGVTNIEVSDKGIKSFDRIARKYGVDYAIKKDRSVSPPKYLIFFKGRDNDAIKAAFTEYTANVVKKKERPSLLQQLRKLRDVAPSLNPDKVRNKHQEAER